MPDKTPAEEMAELGHIKELSATIETILAERDKARHLVDVGWGLVCNVNNGDWKTQSPEWQEAARKWGDEIHGK